MSDSHQHHLVLYDYVADVAQRRAPHRDRHLERIRSEQEAGRLIMAGALGDPPSGGAFVFRDTSPEAIETFVRDDPYMHAGLITGWRVQAWTLV
jgi:uncharacterized protein YciI